MTLDINYLISDQCYISYRYQLIDFQSRSNDWFLYKKHHWAEMGSKSLKYVKSVLSVFEVDLLHHFGWHHSRHAAWNNIIKGSGKVTFT